MGSWLVRHFKQRGVNGPSLSFADAQAISVQVIERHARPGNVGMGLSYNAARASQQRVPLLQYGPLSARAAMTVLVGMVNRRSVS